MTEHALQTLAALQGNTVVWAVGERVQARLADRGVTTAGTFSLPLSVQAITPLVWDILVASENALGSGGENALQLCFNQPVTGTGFAPLTRPLLPLDRAWQRTLTQRPWPGHNLPEVIGDSLTTVRSLIREYLFVSIFRACAESLASENASRLAAMQRAEKNIAALLDTLNGDFHRLRQNDIDEELFDVITGFEALKKGR